MRKKNKTVKTGPSPWITEWLHPRTTIQAVLKLKHQYGMVWLGLIFGIHAFLSRAELGHYGKYVPLWVILAGALALAIPGGLIALLIQGSLLSFVGKWFGGKASQDEARAVAAWSSLPVLITDVFKLLTISVLGINYFLPHDPPAFGVLNSFFYLLGWLGGVIGLVWSLILKVAALAEVHQFNMWKSAATVLIYCVFITALSLLLLRA